MLDRKGQVFLRVVGVDIGAIADPVDVVVAWVLVSRVNQLHEGNVSVVKIIAGSCRQCAST